MILCIRIIVLQLLYPYILYALMQYVINTLYSWEMLSSSLFLLCFAWNDHNLVGAYAPTKEENNYYVLFVLKKCSVFTDQTGKERWLGGGTLFRPPLPLLDRYKKTTWTGISPPSIFVTCWMTQIWSNAASLYTLSTQYPCLPVCVFREGETHEVNSRRRKWNVDVVITHLSMSLQWKGEGRGVTPPLPPNLPSWFVLKCLMTTSTLLSCWVIYSMVKLYLGEQTRRYSRSAAYRQECTSRYVQYMSLSTEVTET